MSETIKLFNPGDRPFGKLSNNSRHPMIIEDKKYPTVTNYILSNLLSNSSHRLQLQHTEIKSTSRVNKDLLKAIDFLQSQKSVKEERVPFFDRNKKVALLSRISRISTKKLRSWNKSDISSAIKDLVVIRKRDSINFTKVVQGAKSEYILKKDPKIFLKRLQDHIIDLKKGDKYGETIISEGEEYGITDPEYNELYKLHRTKESKSEILSEEKKDLENIWSIYSKERAKRSPKHEKEREKYVRYLSDHLSKPFEMIDLKELRRQIILESQLNQMGIYRIFEKNKYSELYEIIRSSLEKGYSVFLNTASSQEDVSVDQALLSTGNLPIVYNDPDIFLGNGLGKGGSNLVGKVLMQLRHNLKLKMQEERESRELNKRDDHIYAVYLAYFILKRELENNHDTLESYFGLTPEQIVKNQSIGVGVPDKRDIIKMYNGGNLNSIIMEEIYKPGSLVMNIRRKGLEELKNRLEKKKQDIIFRSYLKYMIEKNYKEMLTARAERIYNSQSDLSSKKSMEEIEDNLLSNTVDNQMTTFSPNKLRVLKDRVIDLFHMGMLSARLSDRIDNKVKELKIPSTEDIEQAKLAKISPPLNKEDNKSSQSDDNSSVSSEESKSNDNMLGSLLKDMLRENKKVSENIRPVSNDFPEDTETDSTFQYKPPQGEKLIISNMEGSALEKFSPDFYGTKMIAIDGRYYPTIKHYVLANLIASTGIMRKMNSQGKVSLRPGMGIEDGYRYLLVNSNITNPKERKEFLDLSLSSQMYEKIRDDTNQKLLGILTVTGLNKKFEDRSLQNLLLLTGDVTIEWLDPFSLYLGTGRGNQSGFNYVGKTLMSLRETIRNNREGEEIIHIDKDEVLGFIERSSFIQDWIVMRLKDLCNMVYKFQIYLNVRYDLDYSIEEEESLERLIKFILNNIYSHCNFLKNNDNSEVPLPAFVSRTIKKCKGLKINKTPAYRYSATGEKMLNKEFQQEMVEMEKKKNLLYSSLMNRSSSTGKTKEEIVEFKNNQRKEFQQFKKDTFKKDDPENNLLEMQIFEAMQEEQLNEFLGKKNKEEVVHITQEDLEKVKREQDKIYTDFKNKIKKSETEDKYYQQSLTNISQLYWKYIVRLLNELIKISSDSKDNSENSINKIILMYEKESSKLIKCSSIIEDEKQNCTVSALINLLSIIKIFKLHFSCPNNLDTEDVKFAVSIIIEIPYKTKLDDIEEMSDSDKDLEENIVEEDSDSDGEVFDVKEDLFPPEETKDDIHASNTYNPISYGFNGKYKKEDIANIEKLLASFNDNVHSSVNHQLAQYIMDSVKIIEDYKMDPQVKSNRINFFATIQN
jgi:predicted NAD-dependent protein-ADP-ribosyltransferase YbiA (DUF1768 family)